MKTKKATKITAKLPIIPASSALCIIDKNSKSQYDENEVEELLKALAIKLIPKTIENIYPQPNKKTLRIDDLQPLISWHSNLPAEGTRSEGLGSSRDLITLAPNPSPLTPPSSLGLQLDNLEDQLKQAQLRWHKLPQGEEKQQARDEVRTLQAIIRAAAPVTTPATALVTTPVTTPITTPAASTKAKTEKDKAQAEKAEAKAAKARAQAEKATEKANAKRQAINIALQKEEEELRLAALERVKANRIFKALNIISKTADPLIEGNLDIKRIWNEIMRLETLLLGNTYDNATYFLRISAKLENDVDQLWDQLSHIATKEEFQILIDYNLAIAMHSETEDSLQ